MKILKNNISIFVCSLLTMFFITFGVKDGSILLFPDRNSALSGTCILLGLFFVYRLLFSRLTDDYKKGFHILAWIISLFFSFASVMGMFFGLKDSADTAPALFRSFTSVSKAAIVLAGGALMFYLAIRSLGSLRQYAGNGTFACPGWFKKIQDWIFGKGCFLKSLLVLTVCWLPQIIVRYPGAVTTDSIVSLKQYYGARPHTTQHPVFYTLLLGKFSDLGLEIGNVSIGIFLLVLLQVVALLLVLAYTLLTLSRLHVPLWCSWAALASFAAVPIFSAYATTAVIDTFYCTAFLLLMNELIYYLFLPDIYRRSWQHRLLTAAAVLGTFFRHNGIYIIAAVIVLTVIMEIYLLIKKKEKPGHTLIVLLVLVVPMLGGKAASDYLYRINDAQQVSARAMFSVPLQQTARYMIKYGGEISGEDLAVIQKVITWEPSEYKEIYKPLNYDGIKKGFRYNATKQELLDYFKVWFKLFLKHPETYVNATLNQTYFLFSPLADNARYYSDIREGMAAEGLDFSSLYEKPAVFESLNERLDRLYTAFTQLPLVGLLVNQGFYNILLLGICLYALWDKNGKLLFLSLPLLLTLAIAFVGPATYGHPRYTYPIMYSMPLFFSIFAANTKVLSKEKNKR